VHIGDFQEKCIQIVGVTDVFSFHDSLLLFYGFGLWVIYKWMFREVNDSNERVGSVALVHNREMHFEHLLKLKLRYSGLWQHSVLS
jgi:hypothetical protein